MKNIYKISIMIVFILAIIGLAYSGAFSTFNLEWMRAHKQVFQDFVQAHPVQAPLFFILIYIGIILISLPITPLLAVLGGYLFGVVPGIIYSISASVIGSLTMFLVFRYLLHDIARARYGQKIALFKEKFRAHGPSYLLFLQLFPVTPFLVIDLLAGIADVSVTTFLWTTLLGLIPSISVYSFAGKQFGTAQNLFSLPIIIALSLLAALALLPLVLRYFKILRY